jgi:hypothetical protein
MHFRKRFGRESLKAEGAADRRLAGAAVSGAPSDRPRKTVTDSAAQGRACSQGRLNSWFVRLCVKSGRFVTSGQDAALDGSIRAFLELGNTRNRLVHLNYITFDVDKNTGGHDGSLPVSAGLRGVLERTIVDRSLAIVFVRLTEALGVSCGAWVGGGPPGCDVRPEPETPAEEERSSNGFQQTL